jgi:hypothetical protein
MRPDDPRREPPAGAVIEHVVDCETGQAVDQDYEGDLAALLPDPSVAAAERKRKHALRRLRNRAQDDEVVADLLTALGLR